jgi:hypothetical protein
MTIYNMGLEVELITARQHWRWTETKAKGSLKFHYGPEPEVRKSSTLDTPCRVWFVTAKCKESGVSLASGREVSIYNFTATGGLHEMEVECERVSKLTPG